MMFSRLPKYSRGLNWSFEEKRELLNLVERYKSFIENKDCDALSHRRRSEAWAAIAKDFAQCFPPGREPQKMKEQYQRMKSLARKMLAHYAATVLMQGQCQDDDDGNNARQGLNRLPKWIDRIISIIPRDFQEYSRVIKPSDFSESDSMSGQEANDIMFIDGDPEKDNRTQFNLSSMENHQNDEDAALDDYQEPSGVHIKFENDDHQDSHSNQGDRIPGPENNLVDENDSASVASVSNVDNSTSVNPRQDFAFFKRLATPGPSRKRKAPQEQPQWTPETCSERIQWEEHVQRMRHLDEEHAVKMQIMTLHKEFLQQHTHYAGLDPSSAQTVLASSAQMFDSLAKLSHQSRNFTPLS